MLLMSDSESYSLKGTLNFISFPYSISTGSEYLHQLLDKTIFSKRLIDELDGDVGKVVVEVMVVVRGEDGGDDVDVAMMVAWCSVGDGGDGDDVEVEVRMWRLLAGYRGRRAADGRNSSGDGAGKTRKESVYG
ncbi:hypothetical protein Tco_0291763 [Tanacetum coccineum]